jgi:HEAT repeat protein
MSLRDRLAHPDDEVRLDAAREAATSGDLGLVDTLLDLALHDSAEVRTAGGLAEVYEHVGDAAAHALGRILDRRQEDDPRIRATAVDLGHDDGRVATVLYYLGRRYEPLRQELETHPEGRVRLRAVNAVLSTHRTREFSARLMVDPSPAIRIEALNVPKNALDFDACLRLMRDDPEPRVRAAAAKALSYTAVGGEPFVEAARVETHPWPRAALLSCLGYRMRDPAVARAVLGFLAEDAPPVRRQAADLLRGLPDPAVAAAIALRLLVEPDGRVRGQLLGYKHLLALAPELRGLLERLHRDARGDGERWLLSTALAVPAQPSPPDPAVALDERRRAAVEGAVRAAAQYDPQWTVQPAQVFAARMLSAGVDPLLVLKT